MKGWSFNGLVKALKTAAFKDVGADVGQVPLVGDNGLLSTPKSIDATDFNNIDYKSGATLRVNPPYTNWPFDSFLNKEISWHVKVDVGSGMSGDCVLRAFRAGSTEPVAAASRLGGSWSSSLIKTGRRLTASTTPNLLSGIGNYGDWFQDSGAGATPEAGYPVNIAGVLSVSAGPYGSIQEYTTHTNLRKFVRSVNSSGVWTAWVELVQTGVNQNCSFGVVSSQKSYSTTQPASWSDPMNYPDVVAFSVQPLLANSGDFLPILSQKSTLRAEGFPTASTIGQQAIGGAFADTVLVIKGDRAGETVFRFSILGGLSVTSPEGVNSAFATEAYLSRNYTTASALGVYQETPCWAGYGYGNLHPWVLTALINHNHDDHVDTVGRRPLHYYVGDLGWVVFQSIT